MPRLNPWEWVFISVFALFATYAATEPVLAADDCISIGEILVLLPYYALLYFGTLPALIWLGIYRLARASRMNVRRKRDSNLTIGILCALLFLEGAAYFPSDYTATANRALDFIPAAALVLWLAKTWLYERVPQGARS